MSRTAAQIVGEALYDQAKSGELRPSPALVRELLATLPSIPYPPRTYNHPRRKGVVEAWVAATRAAGYPACVSCGQPINRSHWKESLDHCNQCYTTPPLAYNNQELPGYRYDYYEGTVEDRYS